MPLSIAPTMETQEQEPLPPKNKLWKTIEKYIQNIFNTLWYWPKSDIFRIAKIEEKSEEKKAKLDYFDLWDDQKIVYIDGTFFSYKKVDNQSNKNIEILDKIRLREPWVEPSLYQRTLIADEANKIFYIGYMFYQDIPDKMIWSQDIPMIVINQGKISLKPTILKTSSTIVEPTIETINNNIFCIKTHMGWKPKYQYYDPIHDMYAEGEVANQPITRDKQEML